jgi:hypothetical protein
MKEKKMNQKEEIIRTENKDSKERCNEAVAGCCDLETQMMMRTDENGNKRSILVEKKTNKKVPEKLKIILKRL